MKIYIKSVFIALALLASLTQTQNARATVAFTVTPAAVSNTYNGPITLLVTGLTNTETVMVQKFLDVNTNGVIDAGDILWLQFNLTDGHAGMVIGGVTNINVPGDTDGTAGQITAKLNFQGDFSQTIVGKYLFKLSSPVGHFNPLTNSFAVTNFLFAQKFTGTVASNGVAVPNAAVILFQGSGNNLQSGNLTPVGGTVAGKSGVYTIYAPAGTYMLTAFQSNFVADSTAAANLVLGGGATINTNLNLIAATRSISGKIEDAGNSSLGLPGLLVPLLTQGGLLGVCFTDTNGNFTAQVSSNQWQIQNDSSGPALHGYVCLQNGPTVDTTTGSVAGVIMALPKATALFYGTVKDNLGNLLPGTTAIGASDNNNNGNSMYQADGYTDANGNYVTAAVGGLGSSDPWQMQVDNASSYPNYNFSQPAFDQNGGTNISAGQAVPANFTAILAPNQISGNVMANGTNIAGLNVYAYYTTTGGVTYNVNVNTDANGNYSMNVANGAWNVGVNCQGGSQSLDGILGSGTYLCPDGLTVNITNDNGTANFTVQSCSGVQILTASPLPAAQQGTYYYTALQASDCNNNFIWSLNDPADFPSSLSMNFDSGGEIYGTPTGGGTFNFSVHVDDGNGHTSDSNMSLTITPAASPLEITTVSLPNGTNGTFYNQTIQASGGTPPYSWSIPDYSANPPANVNLATNGVLSGTLSTTAGTYYFDVVVTDAASSTAELDGLPLTVVNPPLPPLIITNTSLPNGNVGAVYNVQLGATGGLPPYNWALAPGSANPPPGLSLNPGGLISGMPATNGLFNFKAQATDANSTVTNKIFGIIINPRPVLSLENWLTSQFQIRLTGAPNQNYTVQMSTNLSSGLWTPLFVTNNPATNSFIVVDLNATNKQGFYRILIGP